MLRQDGAGQAVALRLAALELPPAPPSGAQAAREALRACTGGRTVVATVVETDRQGQPVAMIDAGGQDCGLQLLRRGLAVLLPAEAARLPVGDRHRYRRAQEEARARRLGVWADAARPPPDAPRPER
ncbi:hypothetical protein ISF6_0828 [Piscinibacter sakaiensis]|uniref:TNase-like domain-containing protein n=1 Tax=Piscinibacter sakaiensis TaxID=1547922 RepID=A0A0K8NXV9_PISS1|nr:hypothetical protein ISF6_0828 [Piscinibacter sakaiensis]